MIEDDDLFEKMVSAAIGCLAIWGMLRVIAWAESPEDAATVGLGLIGVSAWRMVR